MVRDLAKAQLLRWFNKFADENPDADYPDAEVMLESFFLWLIMNGKKI